MLKVNTGDTSFRFTWSHTNDHKDIKTGQIIRPENKRTTIKMEISQGDAAPYTVSAQTLLGSKDQYSKEVGRKITLDRVLHTRPFTKEIRKAIWEAYLSRPRPKNEEKAAVRELAIV